LTANVGEQEQRDEDGHDEFGNAVACGVKMMSCAVMAIHGTAPMTRP
jgi:hypothetical protein